MVEKEVDAGLETVKVSMPAVITADLRLCEPRYTTLPNIMKAKKKPLETKSVEDFNIQIQNNHQVLKVEDPPVRKAGVIVNDVSELFDKLKMAKAI